MTPPLRAPASCRSTAGAWPATRRAPARFLSATVHGFVSLESAGSFELGRDLERSYAALVESVATALETWRSA